MKSPAAAMGMSAGLARIRQLTDPAPLLSAGQRPKINQPEWQLYGLPTYYNPYNFLQPF